MIEILQIPVLEDNYIYVLHGGGQTAVIDPSTSGPVLEVLNKKSWKLDYILNTHHHSDHVGGNLELKLATGAKILGYAGDKNRIPGIDLSLQDNGIIEICGTAAKIMYIPGHTLGHIAYYFYEENSLFCGDTIFSLGCGRLFEGSAEQMFSSIHKIKNLPINTKIYCAHEYTQSNAKFASSLMPDNKDLKSRIKEIDNLRLNKKPTIPTYLAVELKTNPFLLANNANEFANIRKMKDNFS